VHQVWAIRAKEHVQEPTVVVEHPHHTHREVGSSTFVLVMCFQMFATDLSVAASDYSSLARFSLIASAVCHGTVKMVMPFMQPA
jgi:hypothetical protein